MDTLFDTGCDEEVQDKRIIIKNYKNSKFIEKYTFAIVTKDVLLIDGNRGQTKDCYIMRINDKTIGDYFQVTKDNNSGIATIACNRIEHYRLIFKYKVMCSIKELDYYLSSLFFDTVNCYDGNDLKFVHYGCYEFREIFLSVYPKEIDLTSMHDSNIRLSSVKIYINQFLEYAHRMYIYMNSKGYSVCQILNFTTGYINTINSIKAEVKNLANSEGIKPNDIIFENYNELISIFNSKSNDILNDLRNNVLYDDHLSSYNVWIEYGIKYAILFIRYYIDNVIYGNNEDKKLEIYLDIPDSIDHKNFDWKAIGWED